MSGRGTEPIAPQDLPPRVRGDHRRFVIVAAVCGIALAAFGPPSHFLPHSALGPGLDPSYVFAIGRLPSLREVSPGRDWVFSFGPLAHWLVPPASGTILYASAAARLAMHLAFVGLVLLAGWRRPRVLVAAGAGWFGALVLGLDLPGALVLLLALLWLVPGRWAVSRACIAATLTPGLALVRTNLALAALAILLVAQLSRARVAAGNATRARELWAPLIAALLAGSAVAAAVFPSPGALWAWGRGQLQLAAGYGQAMSMPGDPSVLVSALSLLVTWAALLFESWRRRWTSVAWWTLLTAPVAFAFRHAFVRQDDHVLQFFPLLAGAFALGLLLAAERREIWYVGAALLLALSCGAFALGSRGHALDAIAVPRRSVDSWRALLEPSERAERYRRLDAERLISEQLPASFAAPMREPGVDVDVVPYALSLIAANGFSWAPHPTLQLYTAYTAALDRRVASHFLSQRAADALLVHFGQVDRRNPFWDTPATWRSILADYRFEGVAPDRALLLLRRRAQPRRWVFAPAGSLETSVGEWVETPSAPAGFPFLFAEIEAAPTLGGRVRSLVLSTPPLEARLVFADGLRRVVRLVPGTLEAGILVDPAPRNLAAFERIVSDQPTPRIERIRLEGAGWRMARLSWVGGRLE